MQEDGSTALTMACARGATDIVHLLLAVPGLNVNAAMVSCVSGRHLHAMITARQSPSRLLRAGGVARRLGAGQGEPEGGLRGRRAVTGVAVYRRIIDSLLGY